MCLELTTCGRINYRRILFMEKKILQPFIACSLVIFCPFMLGCQLMSLYKTCLRTHCCDFLGVAACHMQKHYLRADALVFWLLQTFYPFFHGTFWWIYRCRRLIVNVAVGERHLGYPVLSFSLHLTGCGYL